MKYFASSMTSVSKEETTPAALARERALTSSAAPQSVPVDQPAKSSRTEEESSQSSTTSAQCDQLMEVSTEQSASSTLTTRNATTSAAMPSTSCASDSTMKEEIEAKLSVGHPPATVIKVVPAEEIQTNQGPRTVLQGLQGGDLTSNQMPLIHQQPSTKDQDPEKQSALSIDSAPSDKLNVLDELGKEKETVEKEAACDKNDQEQESSSEDSLYDESYESSEESDYFVHEDPMTENEKKQLQTDIIELPKDKLRHLKHMCKTLEKLKDSDLDEIKIDLESMQTSTLRELQHYIAYQKKNLQQKVNGESEGLEHTLLENAVTLNDVDMVRRLLDEEDKSDDKYESKEALLRFALKKKYLDIVKLFVERGTQVELNMIKYLFDLYSNETKEFVVHIIKHSQIRKRKLLKKMFCSLLKYCDPEEYEQYLKSVEILKLLIDLGLPVNDLIYFYYNNYDLSTGNDELEGLTPLHLAVRFTLIKFVVVLLQNGADVNKKTLFGKTALHLTADCPHEISTDIMEVLLKHRAKVNERQENGKTALHLVCKNQYVQAERRMVILFDYGADLNVLDNDERTPLGYRGFCENEVLIGELARMKFEGQEIHQQNLNFVENCLNFKEYFDECLNELQEMKDCVVFNNVSMYDIFSKKQVRKFIVSAGNENFVQSFQSLKGQFRIHEDQLDAAFGKAKVKNAVLQNEEKNIFTALKDHLPGLVLRKVAYFSL